MVGNKPLNPSFIRCTPRLSQEPFVVTACLTINMPVDSTDRNPPWHLQIGILLDGGRPESSGAAQIRAVGSHIPLASIRIRVKRITDED